MYFEFDAHSLRALIQGKFDFRKCLECDGRGWVWVDGYAGFVVSAPNPDSDPDIYYQDQCDECAGLGGNLKILD